jgi:hypothetical protein
MPTKKGSTVKFQGGAVHACTAVVPGMQFGKDVRKRMTGKARHPTISTRSSRRSGLLAAPSLELAPTKSNRVLDIFVNPCCHV